jgi:hypothetical protein
MSMNFDAHNLQIYNLNAEDNDRSELRHQLASGFQQSARWHWACALLQLQAVLTKFGGVAKFGPNETEFWVQILPIY